jgi:hypothetical protein
MTLTLIGNTLLRLPITQNLVTFPAQVNPFMERAESNRQARIVQLYFTCGGYIQEIESDRLAVLVSGKTRGRTVRTCSLRHSGRDARVQWASVPLYKAVASLSKRLVDRKSSATS